MPLTQYFHILNCPTGLIINCAMVVYCAAMECMCMKKMSLETTINELKAKRESILKNAKLTVFERGYKVCALDDMHPKLLKFDAETVRGTRKILEE